MPPPSSPSTAAALAAVAALASRWVERLLATAGPPLTVAEYLALRAIAAGESTATGLARRSGVTEAAVSQLVGGLELGGLIVRAPAPGDLRRRAIELTPGGRGALDAAERLLERGLAEAIGPIPRRQADRLGDALGRVAAALGDLPPPPRQHPPRPRRDRRPPPHRRPG